ncbi:MAG: hypothetical protein AB2777_20635 [Candidatus Thiodiazotropha endolucinida]
MLLVLADVTAGETATEYTERSGLSFEGHGATEETGDDRPATPQCDCHPETAKGGGSERKGTLPTLGAPCNELKPAALTAELDG